MRYWLMKSEPDVFSIDDLAAKGVEHWDGVRNYQARNFMRDDMKVGDGVLFYHSNAEPSGVAGMARVAREAYPDHTALDPASPYHDPKSDPANPRWFMVDVEFVERFPALIPLSRLQKTPGLEDMMVTRKGMRLSVQPVTPREWQIVVALGRGAAPPAAETPARSKRPSRNAPPRGTSRKSAARSSRNRPGTAPDRSRRRRS